LDSIISTLQVSDKRQYQIHLVSSSGPIDVLLIGQQDGNSVPSVVHIPPKETWDTNAVPAAAGTSVDEVRDQVTVIFELGTNIL